MVQRKYIQILITLTAAFAFALIAPAQGVHAADVDFSVVVSEVPVLEITLSDSTDITPTTISQNIKPNPDGTPTFTTSDIYVTVATSNPTGYYLNMHTSSTSLTSGANEIPSLDNEYTCTINTASSCAFTNNSWGYRLSTDTANTYKPIPNSTGEDIDSYDTVTNGRTVNVILGTKIDSSLPAGSYATTFSFVATANATGPYYIQDLTKDICAVFAEGENYVVYDKRDGNDYTVRYINGNCWMTQNLRIIASSGKSAGVVAAEHSNFTGNDVVMKNSGKTFNNFTTLQYYQHDEVEYGVAYNYAAATAGTIVGSSNSTTASQDICPSGWSLPNDDQIKTVLDYISEFAPVKGGWYGPRGHSAADENSSWWSQNANSGTDRHLLYYSVPDHTLTLYDGSGNNRQCGIHIRCVAQ